MSAEIDFRCDADRLREVLLGNLYCRPSARIVMVQAGKTIASC
jgi:hypothetical protein